MSNVNYDIATYAASLLSQGWCQHYLATNADGTPMFTNSPQATRFCMYGAVSRAAHDLKIEWTDDLPNATLKILHAPNLSPLSWQIALARYTDYPARTQAECVAKMIAIAEAVR